MWHTCIGCYNAHQSPGWHARCVSDHVQALGFVQPLLTWHSSAPQSLFDLPTRLLPFNPGLSSHTHRVRQFANRENQVRPIYRPVNELAITSLGLCHV